MNQDENLTTVTQAMHCAIAVTGLRLMFLNHKTSSWVFVSGTSFERDAGRIWYPKVTPGCWVLCRTCATVEDGNAKMANDLRNRSRTANWRMLGS